MMKKIERSARRRTDG